VADVTIVVVAFNSWPEVGRCLASIADHPPRLTHEVIVVDNASSDGTADEVARGFPSVQLIASSTNDGYGVAVNRAVSRATGRFLVFLNPDTEVTAGALDRLVADATQATTGVVGPRLVTTSGLPQPSARRFPSPTRTLVETSRLHLLLPRATRARWLLGGYCDQDETREVDWVSGACHVMRRDVWDTVGALTEETFCGFDDFEYCWRARGAGYRTLFRAEAEVYHSVGASVGARWRPAEVDLLAVHNMFVLLPGLWPGWRIRSLALAEALAAVSEMITSTIHPARARRDATAFARARRRATLLFGLATGRVEAIRRYEPAAGHHPGRRT
jgi:N-acetylglucosaminyl-diphospho-decaprenol L-rhamnosyltransferase